MGAMFELLLKLSVFWYRVILIWNLEVYVRNDIYFMNIFISNLLYSQSVDVTVGKLGEPKSVTSAYQETAGLNIYTIKN
jgi:hypothetical protein